MKHNRPQIRQENERKSNQIFLKNRKGVRLVTLFISFALSFILLFSCFITTPAYAAEKTTKTTGYVDATWVNIRSGPGVSYQWVGCIPNPTTVEITGSDYDNNGTIWYQIIYEGISGYITSMFVTDIKEVTIDTSLFGDFPENYRSILASISANHPNYKFVADYYDLTLEEVVDEHYGSKTYYGSWASKDIINTYMDPLTYLNEADIFVFAYQGYNSSQTETGLTEMFEVGNAFLNTDSYKNALIQAAKDTGVSPYVLAATIILEKGWHADEDNPDVYGRQVYSGKVTADILNVRSGPGVNYSATDIVSRDEIIYIAGTKKDGNGADWYWTINNGRGGYVKAEFVTDYKYYNTYYNLFSVNQTDSNPVIGGIYYSMNHGWDTPEKSLIGGASFYKSGYFDIGQDTYYYKDFNLPNQLWWHEYASGILDPICSAEILSYAYTNDPDETVVLYIPIYRSVVEEPVDDPTEELTEDPPANSTNYNGVDYSPVYDFEYYYNRYSDLRNAFGDNEEAYFNHFIKYGMSEGRQAKSTFNANEYKNNYGDLQRAFGDDTVRYYMHFINYGQSEGRHGTKLEQQTTTTDVDYSAVYDFEYYFNRYSDLRNAFGDNEEAYLKHFIKYGMSEGRQAKSTFNVTIYKNKYSDLRNAYGDDLKNYYLHYIKWGQNEQRIAY